MDGERLRSRREHIRAWRSLVGGPRPFFYPSFYGEHQRIYLFLSSVHLLVLRCSWRPTCRREISRRNPAVTCKCGYRTSAQSGFPDVLSSENRGGFLREPAACVKRRRTIMDDFSYLSVAFPSTPSALWRCYFPCRGRCIGAYIALFGCIQQRLAGCWIIDQLGPVPSLEFLPFGWIVTEPATQIVAGR
jgi:hypothetical protein